MDGKLSKNIKEEFDTMDKMPLSKFQNLLIKRVFDIIVSFFTLIIIFPWVFIFVAIGIKLSMPGAIFFSQKRIGKNRKEFTCYKFRSMKINKESDTQVAAENDERITRFGAFIRKYSLDELPQFFNVLKGDMSIVGPRPHLQITANECSKVFDHYYDRLQVKPGITCLAQVMGYRDIIEEKHLLVRRAKFDLYYIKHWSLWMDIKIILKTFLLMLSGDENSI